MGLRHRTAMGMLRMQRRNAESNGQRVSENPPQRTARNVYFSQIDPARTQRHRGMTPPMHRPDQEHSQRLLQRLRQALHPLLEAQCQASQEYESLQDELLRLSQHIAQQKSRTSVEVWDNSQTPYHSVTSGPDSLPYRTIKIMMHETPSIERLTEAPSDLSRYRQVVPEAPAPIRSLTLVTSETKAGPEVPDLLIDGEAQMGQATANLTQQSLDSHGPRKDQVSIHPELALSLLDT